VLSPDNSLLPCIWHDLLVLFIGIGTRYGQGGPGIEFWWARDFPHASGAAQGLRSGRDVHYPPAYSADVNKSRAVTVLHYRAFMA
jgi:hypothetical protein